MDAGIVDFNVLEFKLDFSPCLYLFILVDEGQSFPLSFELLCSGLEHARVHALAVPIYTDGSKYSATDFGVFVCLFIVTLIFTAELVDIFLALSRIYFPDSATFVIYSDSRNAMQALGSFYTRYPLVLKYNVSFVTFTPVENLPPSAGSPPMWGSLATKKLIFGQKG